MSDKEVQFVSDASDNTLTATADVDQKDVAEPIDEAAGKQGGGDPKRSWFSGVMEFVVAFAIMLVAILALRTWVVEPFEIPSGSMLQTIQIGDRVFAEKISVALNDMPEQGEIVTFVNPRDPSETLIKRVIAVGGQTVDLRDGVVYVDGVALDEPYTNGQGSYPMRCDGKVQKTDITYPYTIPEGCFWAMGDNRGNSADSRVFGAVDASTITGHAVFRYWPLFRTAEDGSISISIGPLD